jgi:hypothetical protein
MKQILLAAAFAATLSASPALAFSWQQFWTGATTPEDSPLNARCGTLTIGFVKAAPALQNFNNTVQNDTVDYSKFNTPMQPIGPQRVDVYIHRGL